MNREQFEILIEAAHNCGLEPRSYSGRGMYGRNYVGFTCDNPVKAAVEICTAIVSLADGTESPLELLEELDRPRWDSMGQQSILYFEGVEWIDLEPAECPECGDDPGLNCDHCRDS